MKAREDDRMELRENKMTTKAALAKAATFVQDATINEV